MGYRIKGRPIECRCDKCINSCTETRPGWFKPGEAEKASEFLKVPFSIFSGFLERQSRPLGPVFWAPKRLRVNGEVIEDSKNPWELGRCVFLTKDNLCSIHPVKPFECKEFDHTTPTTRDIRGEMIKEIKNAGKG